MKKTLITFKAITIVLLFSCIAISSHAQLTVSTAMTPTQLVQNVLVGGGVTVTNVTFTGAVGSIGSFTTGPSPTNLGISSGIIMSSGLVNGTPAIGSPVSSFASTANLTGSDPDLQTLIPSYTINDACVLQFDFIPLSDTIRFRYVFGSEEYPEWVGSSFNDVFGFFVSGPNPMGGNYVSKNIALLPGTTLPVTIDNVNGGSNAMYYVDNQGMSGGTIVYDGFTVVLTAWCLVVPCIQYHIKLAIGDAGDSSFDSAVFLEENSFSTSAVSISTYYSTPQAGNDAIEGCSDGIISFKLPNPATSPFFVSYSIIGTATNGTDYTLIPNSVTIPTGQDSINLVIHPVLDGIVEGTETVILVVQTSVCGGSDTVTINIIDNMQMGITASNDTTICGGQATIWGQASGGIQPYSYVWNNGAGNTSSVTVSPAITTTYIVSVSDLCGTTVTENVTVYIGQGSADAGNDVTLCFGESTTLAATGGSGGYLWSNGIATSINAVTPNFTTTYYVTVYGACDAYDSVTVFVNPLPVITASSNFSSIFLGTNVTLTATGGTTYQWSANPSDPSLAGQGNSSSPIVSPQFTTTYSVVGFDANGCSGSASVIVIVIPVFPEVNFGAFPVSGCEPLVVQFFDSTTKVAPGAEYFWEFGNGYTSTMINPQAYYPEHGLYDVSLTVTNPGGFSATIKAFGFIEVYPKPITHFMTLPNREVTIFENTVGFFDQTIGNPEKWSWTFGDGDTSDLATVYHTYKETGQYNVYLIATNIYGCADTAFTTVSVRPDYYLYVPSAFTPNNDGKNDVFYVQGGGILDEGFVMRIFNRWGEEIFFTKNLTEGWDGTYKGQKSQCSCYIYIINFFDENFHTHEVKGSVSLFR